MFLNLSSVSACLQLNRPQLAIVNCCNNTQCLRVPAKSMKQILILRIIPLFFSCTWSSCGEPALKRLFDHHKRSTWLKKEIWLWENSQRLKHLNFKDQISMQFPCIYSSPTKLSPTKNLWASFVTPQNSSTTTYLGKQPSDTTIGVRLVFLIFADENFASDKRLEIRQNT